MRDRRAVDDRRHGDRQPSPPAVTSATAAGGNAKQAAAAATPHALVDGFQAAFYVGAVTALIGLVCTVILIQRQTRVVVKI